MRSLANIPPAVWWSMVWFLGTLGVGCSLGGTGRMIVWTSAVWPVVWLGYQAGWGWSAILVVLGQMGLVGLMLGGVAPPVLVKVAIGMAVLPVALAVATGAGRRREAAWDRRRWALLEAHHLLEQRQRAFQHEHQVLEQTIGQLATLYQLTKRFLDTLDRADAVRCLSDALTAAFPRATFRTGFAQPTQGPDPQVAQVWQLRSDGAQPVMVTAADAWLLDQLRRQPVLWSSDPMISVASSGSLHVPEALLTATAFPLVLDRELQGFLVAEALSAEEVDRCGILVSQFAVAIRRIRLYERVQELAIQDGLTGLFVRRHFVTRLREEILRAARHEVPLAFLMVDIDHFKQINDTYGHLVGDAVLRELATLLRTQVREVDLLGRYGGEEFAMGLLDTDAAQARVAAERIGRVVRDAVFRAYDERVAITVSIGVAVFPHDASDTAELIEQADAAMFKAKLAGRDRVILVDG